MHYIKEPYCELSLKRDVTLNDVRHVAELTLWRVGGEIRCFVCSHPLREATIMALILLNRQI